MRVEPVATSSACATNVSNVANRCVFTMSRGSWCSKSSLAKAEGAEVSVSRTGEKWHAAVARSTFASQNVEKNLASETCWKFQCPKMPRGCGAKHICKSKCRKHLSVGDILEAAMFKNCTPLWREAYLYVKMWKTPQRRRHFGSCDVQKLHAAVAGSTFVSQNVENAPHSRATFWSSHVQKWHAAVAESTFARQNALNTCVLQHFETFLTD